MALSRAVAGLLGAGLLMSVGLAHRAASYGTNPFPPISVSLSAPVATVSDFAGIAFGFRKLTADLAWIQALLYYGTFEDGREAEAVEQGGGHYPLFLAYCRRVVTIDPNFKYAYYFGAGVLGWNLNRLDEADELLREGIRAHPKEWRFQQYLAAMAYQKNHDINSLTAFLEGFVKERDCPNLLRSILANIYKKQERYADSIRIWMSVYETGDRLYLTRASSQIQEMYPLVMEMGHKAH